MDVVKSLNDAALFSKSLDVRAVKERLSVLITAFQANDLQKKFRSGTEEDYNKMEQLLQEILTLVKSADETRQQKSKAHAEQMAMRKRTAAFMVSAGEHGRKKGEQEAPDDVSVLSDDEDAMNDWLSANGGDIQDWQEEVRLRRAEKAATVPQMSEERKFKSSRAMRKDKEAESDIMWMNFMKEQDEKKLKFKEQQAADAKEIELKKLDIERERIAVEKLKWQAILGRGSNNNFFDL
ncbi:uncharacterized protein LOC129597639 [Paramacrobiotus metropolitanus]|uniref:uncharacterized protein LOC129597639 n=1 Tax=Paramacrobiotus metropolitanus TaxID=2943436 RepID=UPI002445FFF4|nr:uncharacterized protein LOC129597639 [Paramacrobiotus metropolitanus]